VAFHPKEEGLLASCGDDNLIKIWKVQPEGENIDAM